jgi:hypothetical protein
MDIACKIDRQNPPILSFNMLLLMIFQTGLINSNESDITFYEARKDDYLNYSMLKN